MHPDPGTSRAPYRLYNIGNHKPVELMHLIATLEQALGITAVKELLPMQPGDVPATYADIEDLDARHRLHARPPRSRSGSSGSCAGTGTSGCRSPAERQLLPARVGDQQRPMLGAVFAEPDAVARRYRRHLGLERLWRHPVEAVRLARVRPHGALVAAAEHMHEFVLDQAVARHRPGR